MEDERKYEPKPEPEHAPTQLEVLRGVLMLAAQYDAWLTLGELARKTHFPEASISAQLRHLRKLEHGAHCVEKRHRQWEESLRTNTKERIWEYRIQVGAGSSQ
jgi:hypothetical protein